MIDLDLGAAAEEIVSLPWVAQVTVERSWPGTVEYRIEEWAPVAVVATADGTLCFVGPERHLLGPAGVRPANLVELRGVTAGTSPGEGVAAEAADAVEVAAAMPPDLAEVLPVLSVDGAGELALGRSGGGVVQLGDADRVEEKLVAVRTVLEGADLACLERLDVRVPTAPVIVRAC